MSEVPAHITALRKSDDLRRRLDVDWLDAQKQQELRAYWLEIWAQVPYGEPFHTDNLQRLQRCVPLAQGTTRQRRLDHTVNTLALVWDPADPEFVFVSLSHAFPPLLWIKADAQAQAVLDAVAPYLVEAKPLPQLSRSARVVKMLDVPDRGVIERTLENLELWLDDTMWASAFDDDPWLDVQGPLSMVQQTIWRKDVAEEHSGRFPSISCRTLWSKSNLRIEQHPFGMWVFDLRYDPATDADVIALVNEISPGHLPLDLPVDLAASLLRDANLGDVYVSDCRARGQIVDAAAMECALAPGETRSHAALLAALAAKRDDPAALDAIADLALAYRYDAVLFEMTNHTAGTDLGDWLLTYLAPTGGQ